MDAMPFNPHMAKVIAQRLQQLFIWGSSIAPKNNSPISFHGDAGGDIPILLTTARASDHQYGNAKNDDREDKAKFPINRKDNHARCKQITAA